MTLKVQLLPIGEYEQFFDAAKFARITENALEETARAMEADYRVTVQTWTNRPNFQIDRRPYERDIYTTSDIYRFVSEGTRVRYATMTPNFRAKTSPGIIRSRGGQGGVMFIRKDKPKPGIVARQFAETINRKWARQWPRQYGRALASELFR